MASLVGTPHRQAGPGRFSCTACDGVGYLDERRYRELNETPGPFFKSASQRSPVKALSVRGALPDVKKPWPAYPVMAIHMSYTKLKSIHVSRPRSCYTLGNGRFPFRLRILDAGSTDLLEKC
jgi:hypothetical protein